MIVIRVFSILMLMLFLSCTNYVEETPSADLESYSEYTEYSIEEEALQMATSICNERYIPDDLFDRIFTDLIEIRTNLRTDEFALIRYAPRCELGRVSLSVDPAIGDMIRRKRYHGWDELHDDIEPYSISVSCREEGWTQTPHWERRYHEANCLIEILFSENINPMALIYEYEQLDDINSASVRKFKIQDPNIYIKLTSNGIEYLFAKTKENTTRYTRYLHAYYANGKLVLKPIFLSAYDERVWKEGSG